MFEAGDTFSKAHHSWYLCYVFGGSSDLNPGIPYSSAKTGAGVVGSVGCFVEPQQQKNTNVVVFSYFPVGGCHQSREDI